ncbi:MAG: DUF2089 domain-containing protein [Trueperaceae bacterium]|nr:DUF2089 domain-containing protein [Trueperaceae bacterium]
MPRTPRYPMPTHCPVSGEPLEVTRLESPVSGVVLEGRFQPNEFALLPPEPLEFLRIFVRVRGNLKEAERILGVSYPTVRARFERMLRALGYEAPGATPGETAERGGAADSKAVDEVLASLEAGEIDPDEATARLEALRGG